MMRQEVSTKWRELTAKLGNKLELLHVSPYPAPLPWPRKKLEVVDKNRSVSVSVVSKQQKLENKPESLRQ